MTTPRDRPARDVRGLQRWINWWADASSETQVRIQRRIALVAIAAMLDGERDPQVLLPAADSGLDRDAKAQAEQVRSVSVERVAEQLGNVPVPLMLDVDEALRLHLAL